MVADMGYSAPEGVDRLAIISLEELWVTTASAPYDEQREEKVPLIAKFSQVIL